MKFEFKKQASRVLDYIIFPGVIYFFEEERDTENEIMKSVISKDYINFIENMNDLLVPYKDEIMKYYNKDIYSSYDFSNILIHGFPLYDYKSEHSFLSQILSYDENTLRKTMIKTLISLEDGEEDVEEDVEESSIAFNDEEFTEATALSFINELQVDASNKWNLLMMIQKPKQYLRGFIDLLEKVQSIFYRYYDTKEDEVIQYGENLEKRLSNNTEKTFKEITHEAISYDFGGSDVCYLYVSAMYPYSLRFLNTKQRRIVWGIKTEESFKALNEIRQDKLSERVKIFKALGDKTRYETLKLLANGVTSIKDIAHKLDVSSATISYHINEFLTSGIINLKFEKSKKAGYKVDYKKLQDVMGELIKDLNFPE